jgi:PRC-barrel domain
VAETTQDEREPESTRDEREPESREEEREPESREESSEDDREPESRAESGGDDREKDEEEERKPEPPDLPEPEEKSADDLLGTQVVDPHGYTIGKIDALFVHGDDERARWARVKTGIVRKDAVFVPLHDAQADGGQIRVVYEKEHVNEAPEIEPEGNELSDDDADVLHTHYGLERVKGLTKETLEEGDIDLPRETRDATPQTMKERPWAVEKYPLPDMERPEGEESSGEAGEERREGEEREEGEQRQEGGERQEREEPSHEARQESSDQEGEES